MITVTTKRHGAIDVPMHVNDVPSVYWNEHEVFNKRIAQRGADIEHPEYVQLMDQQVRCIFRDLPTSVPYGKANGQNGLRPQSLFATSDGEGLGTLPITICSLHEHILALLDSVELQWTDVEYRGDIYTLTPFAIAPMANVQELTTQEVVEVLQLDKLLNAYYEEATKEAFDYTRIAPGNFELELLKIAALLRKKTADGIEPLPHTETGLINFLTERREYFTDLDYQTILQVRFFFQQALTLYSLAAQTIPKDMTHTGKD